MAQYLSTEIITKFIMEAVPDTMSKHSHQVYMELFCGHILIWYTNHIGMLTKATSKSLIANETTN